MSKRKAAVVSASDIGMATFCPYALYLRENGGRPSLEGKKKLRDGKKSHKTWARRKHSRLKKGLITIFVLVISVLSILFIFSLNL